MSEIEEEIVEEEIVEDATDNELFPDEEIDEEDIGIVVEPDQVSWTKSDYATTEWEKN